MKLDTKEFSEKMQKTTDGYRTELASIRAGRATPEVLRKVTIDYYGTPTAINAVANIAATDARTLTITPWDATQLKAIERAILASDVGITPVNDGKVIRLCFPQLTEDRRNISKMGEAAKVAIRNIRREANDKTKAMKKNSEMTEDEVKASDKAVQDLTDKFIAEIDRITAAKSKELMEV